MLKKNWEKEFDEELDWLNYGGSLVESDSAEEVKTFIRKTLKTVEDKYSELIMAVVNKYEGETRHETALRYIKQAEEKIRESHEKAHLPESLEIKKQKILNWAFNKDNDLPF